MRRLQPLILVIALALIAGAILLLESKKDEQGEPPSIEALGGSAVVSSQAVFAEKEKHYDRAKEITTPDGFINTNGMPITIGAHIGKKVIILDVWTYSCINCQRTIPYLNDWHKKYGDKGLLIVGLHTPEFDFEKEYKNVASAVEKFKIHYPVVLNNDHSTARAYGMRYWPEKYLIDIDGFIVYKHIGEGAYAETEKKIQELLEERSQLLGTPSSVDAPVSAVGEGGAQSGQSPEVYFGAARNDLLSNGTPHVIGRESYELPRRILPDSLYLGGVWDSTNEYAQSASTDSKVIFRYRAKEVFMVAEAAAEPVEIEVLRDGKPLGDFRGEDVLTSGGKNVIIISNARLYKLVLEREFGEHTLEVRVNGEGARFFTFTFGS